MFLITYKKGLNSERSKIEFDRPLTFFNANEMLLEAVTKYKQTGQSMKISYKIVKTETGESVFNSKILIDRDIPSLYQLIKENSNAPKTVIDYIIKVENREVIEAEDTLSFNDHFEEKTRLEQLKSEKNVILQQLKKEDKERQQRDIEHQKKMKEIHDEKIALEKAIQLKEKEEEIKESERIEALRLLEEEKNKAMKEMEEKRNLDKKKKEEHERRLKQVEDEAKKAEYELASIQTEFEKNELERKKELQALEEKNLEMNRTALLLKAESEKDEVKHQQELVDYKKLNDSKVGSNRDLPVTTTMPKPTLKERLQELDFETVKERSIQMVKVSAKGSINGSKKAYRLIKEHSEKRASQKQEKLVILNKKVELEEKLALEKIKFMDELKKERLKQEKEMKKEAKLKERERLQQVKIEDRYLAAKKKRIRRPSFYTNRPLKTIFGMIAFIAIALFSIHYFDLGQKFPVLNPAEDYVNDFISKIINTIKRS